MRRLITIEIDAGAELCGNCDHWSSSPKCDVFGLLQYGNVSTSPRHPECLAAEVASVPAPPAAHGAHYEVADEDPS